MELDDRTILIVGALVVALVIVSLVNTELAVVLILAAAIVYFFVDDTDDVLGVDYNESSGTSASCRGRQNCRSMPFKYGRRAAHAVDDDMSKHDRDHKERDGGAYARSSRHESLRATKRKKRRDASTSLAHRMLVSNESTQEKTFEPIVAQPSLYTEHIHDERLLAEHQKRARDTSHMFHTHALPAAIRSQARELKTTDPSIVPLEDAASRGRGNKMRCTRKQGQY